MIKDGSANMNRTYSILDFKDNQNKRPILSFAGLKKSQFSNAINQSVALFHSDEKPLQKP